MPIDICKQRLQQMEKVAEEIKFDVLPNDNKKRHNRLENVAEQNYSSLFDKKVQNVYKMWKM